MDVTRMEFHIGDLLSVTTGRLLSSEGVDGLYKILNFMTGGSVWTHQLGEATALCKPYLLEQHPSLGRPEITTFAMGEIILMLESDSIASKEDHKHLVGGWLSKIIEGGYGVVIPEYLAVSPLPDGLWKTDPRRGLEANEKVMFVVGVGDD
ncbi:hypothetical protein KKF61_09190 [Patescibacteria group bacterium]|nr:hypothetical protein [Patescibacteria group bacterium]